jgi:hypothetical protein
MLRTPRTGNTGITLKNLLPLSTWWSPLQTSVDCGHPVIPVRLRRPSKPLWDACLTAKPGTFARVSKQSWHTRQLPASRFVPMKRLLVAGGIVRSRGPPGW